ncbi:MAG: MFS transporter [Chitinophaga sp.]|uniref:MFS transporter n=1 Tax=Chitinophaga sp. TaxID=1869181 RepID=UPI0025C63AA5|nr:MFS transporter [Chitinophaga sp.]MBV8254141.1 MFS transporter [Chitinophaga sp.]
MKISTFSAFKSRNYRLYFSGQSVSLIGTWMQKTAVSWVVYAHTHSKFMLGLTLFASMFPSFILSFLGGIASDRYNRYKLLLLTQFASMLQALALTLLVYFKHYSVWHIIGLSAVLGVINAFDVPARQSLVYEMVDNKADLPNALALNSSMVNLSRLIGPGIAGIALEKLGDDICFALNTFSFVAVIVSLLMMKLPAYQPSNKHKDVLRELKEGLAYVRNTPNISQILSILGMMSLFVLPFTTLIPVYAKDIFKGSATTFGVIDSAIGLGALLGALYLASLKPGRNLRKVLAINTLVFGVGLVLFSHTTWYPIALFFATLCGFGMMSQITISNTIIQTTVDPAVRGRVISLYAMVFFGLQPLGGLLVGAISQYIGTPDTVLMEGIFTLIVGGYSLRLINKREESFIALQENPQEVRVNSN